MTFAHIFIFYLNRRGMLIIYGTIALPHLALILILYFWFWVTQNFLDLLVAFNLWLVRLFPVWWGLRHNWVFLCVLRETLFRQSIFIISPSNIFCTLWYLLVLYQCRTLIICINLRLKTFLFYRLKIQFSWIPLHWFIFLCLLHYR